MANKLKTYNVGVKATKDLVKKGELTIAVTPPTCASVKIAKPLRVNLNNIVLTNDSHNLIDILGTGNSQYIDTTTKSFSGILTVAKGCTDLSSVFDGFETIEEIDATDLDVSNITNLGSAFSFCTALKSVDISTWDISKATTMQCMFQFCGNLETIHGILDFAGCGTPKNGGDVGNFGAAMFEGCDKLKNVKIRNANWLSQYFPIDTKFGQKGYEILGLKENQFEIVE